MHNYQIDYVKLKLYKVNENMIKWNAFIDHPTIKKRYRLCSPSSELYCINFDMYIDNGSNVVIEMSIPYLLKNHNYLSVDAKTTSFVIEELSFLTGLKIGNAKVIEFEFGAFESCQMESLDYISRIVGLPNLDVLKSARYMRLFGNVNIQYKLYDAVKNSKRKKTYTRGRLPKSRLIKHELRIKRPDNLSVEIATFADLTSNNNITALEALLKAYRSQLIFKEPQSFQLEGGTMTQVLYTTLKNLERNLEAPVFNLAKDVIENSALSPSQKSKRKKSLRELETTYNAQLKKDN